MEGYYVILTGARGNSGDDLIRHAAMEHFRRLRPDRTIHRLDGWKPLDAAALELVNGARALVLLGGPALRYNTYPDVYPLVEDLSSIKVPIVMLGVGYRDADGDWSRTGSFELSSGTLRLLDRVEQAGHPSGVRCFHTLNVLHAKGYRNFRMTGCPAFYHHDHLGRPFQAPTAPRKLAFATGRMYLRDRSLEQQQQRLIAALASGFPGLELTVALHDPIRNDGPTRSLLRELEQRGIPYREVAHHASTLAEFYAGMDMQVGYRVHAHLHLCSTNKPSILVCEDGRGKGMRTTLGGSVFDGHVMRDLTPGEALRRMTRGRSPRGRTVQARPGLEDEVVQELAYGLANGFPRMAGVHALINAFWPTYTHVLNALP